MHHVTPGAGRVDGIAAAAGGYAVLTGRLHAVVTAAELDKVTSAIGGDGVIAATKRQHRVVAAASVDSPIAVVAGGYDDQVATYRPLTAVSVILVPAVILVTVTVVPVTGVIIPT